MIVEALIIIIYMITLALITPFLILPDVDLSNEFGEAITQIANILATFDFIIPVNFIVIVLSVWITYSTSYVILKGINWLIRKIPSVS